MTASRSTMLAMMIASSRVSPCAAIPSRISGVSRLPNSVSSRRTTATGVASAPLISILERLGQDVALERASRREVGEEVELVEELGRRRLEDRGELLHVHRHLAGGERRDDLLEPEALEDRDARRRAERLALERRDDL